MKVKGHGEVAIVEYEDYDENGLISQGFFIESEMKGTILKIDKKNEN